MSVWTEVQGGMVAHKRDNFSLKKHVEDYFEHQCSLDYTKPEIKMVDLGDSYQTLFEFSICEDGLSAAKVVHDILKSLPKGSIADVQANVRFVK